MAIFGVNLFANASADAFARTKDNLKGSNKQAKELQKTLSGFDEMNIIQDSGATATGGGGGGIAMPSTDLTQGFDLSGIWETMLGWKDAFMTFWDDIIDFWENDWWDFFSSIGGDFGTFFEGLGLTLKGFWEYIQGIGEMLIGLLDMLWGVITLDFDKVKEGFGILPPKAEVISAIYNSCKNVRPVLFAARYIVTIRSIFMEDCKTNTGPSVSLRILTA